MKSNSFLAIGICIIILVIGIALRSYDIEVRPLHHDEGVNYLFFQQVQETGLYRYSHENYHGPLFFYLHTYGLELFGDGVLGFRLPTIIAGSVLILAPLLFLPQCSLGAAVIALGFLALSPSLIFHSRYAIHEMMLALTSLLTAVYIYKFFDKHSKNTALVVAALMGLSFTLKETTVLVVAPFFLAVPLTFGWKRSLAGVKTLFPLVPICIVVGTFVISFIFSGALQWGGGVREFFMAFPQWFSRGVGDTGHFKPGSYYLTLLWETEPVVAVLLPLAILFGFLWRDSSEEEKYQEQLSQEMQISRFMIFWGLGCVFVHSLIPYKMPWIHIQWVPALSIGTALFVFQLCGGRSTIPKTFLPLLVIALFFVTAWRAHHFNFKVPFGKDNPLSYVHSTYGLVDAAREATEIMEERSDIRLLIDLNSYWPLPYYIRTVAKRAAYRKIQKLEEDSQKFALMMIDKKRKKEFVDKLDPECWDRRYYRFSDVSEGYFVKNRCVLNRS